MKHRASCNYLNKSGFTIVELLIVIVVIAILAAITIVAYTGMTNKTNDSVVKADAAAAAKKLEIAKVDNGHYPILPQEFASGFKFAKGSYSTDAHNVLYCLNKTTDQYALGLISKSSKGFLVVNGKISEGVTVDPTAVCAAVGTTWTQDATTTTYHGYLKHVESWNTGAGWSWID